MEPLHPTKTKYILILVAILVVGFLIGFFVPRSNNDEETSSELRLGSSSLTNPLLECDLGGATIGSRKEDFTPELIEFTERLKKDGGVSEIAVYYRDLNNGPVIGIDQNIPFAPASLLKIPLLIAYLSWSETLPSVLDEQVRFEGAVDVGYQQQFAPSMPLEAGVMYSIRTLLERMTIYSDNQALVILFERLPKAYQEELYTLLGVDTALITDPVATLTVKQYSIFFRILFNASFLSRANSEYALGLLTKTTFVEGLRAGVPQDIVVAHKFGERKIENDLQQFHDCGIVYYPNHPFLLCIMTRGEEASSLIDAIRETTKFVYEKIDEQYR